MEKYPDNDFKKNFYALLICIFNPQQTTYGALKKMGAEVRDENCEYKGAVHMKMVELEYDFNEAIKQRAKFIGVLIKMPGFDRPEVIINSYENFNK
jgi:hypothetical protein